MEAMREVTIENLRTGDILLSRGTTCLSFLIALIDSSKYSHAGFFDGKKSIDAGLEGVLTYDVTVPLSAQSYIHVYRYSGTIENPDNLVAAAHHYVGEQFAVSQLFLGLILLTMRRGILPAWLKRRLVPFIESALDWMNEVIEAGKEPVTCSEFVCRAYFEAAPRGKYRLDVPRALIGGKGLAGRRQLLEPTHEELDALRLSQGALRLSGVIDQLDKLCAIFLTPKDDMGPGLWKARPDSGGKDAEGAEQFDRLMDKVESKLQTRTVGAHGLTGELEPSEVPEFVTPRDIQNATNVRPIGRLTAQ